MGTQPKKVPFLEHLSSWLSKERRELSVYTLDQSAVSLIFKFRERDGVAVDDTDVRGGSWGGRRASVDTSVSQILKVQGCLPRVARPPTCALHCALCRVPALRSVSYQFHQINQSPSCFIECWDSLSLRRCPIIDCRWGLPHFLISLSSSKLKFVRWVLFLNRCSSCDDDAVEWSAWWVLSRICGNLGWNEDVYWYYSTIWMLLFFVQISIGRTSTVWCATQKTALLLNETAMKNLWVFSTYWQPLWRSCSTIWLKLTQLAITPFITNIEFSNLSILSNRNLYLHNLRKQHQFLNSPK